MRRVIMLLGALSGAVAAQPADAQDRVVVNGKRVTQEQYAQELGRLGLPLTIPVPDGDYWYDRISGLWGVRGGPTLGQLPPDLTLGGELSRTPPDVAPKMLPAVLAKGNRDSPWRLGP